MLLELMKVSEKRGRYIKNGKIRIGFDNRKHYRNIVDGTKKSNVCTQEAGSEIAMITMMLSAMQFEEIQ